jgi:hypothetical protein
MESRDQLGRQGVNIAAVQGAHQEQLEEFFLRHLPSGAGE